VGRGLLPTPSSPPSVTQHLNTYRCYPSFHYSHYPSGSGGKVNSTPIGTAVINLHHHRTTSSRVDYSNLVPKGKLRCAAVCVGYLTAGTTITMKARTIPRSPTVRRIRTDPKEIRCGSFGSGLPEISRQGIVDD